SGARLSSPSTADLDGMNEPTEGETLIYVTTPERVTRVPLADMAKATAGATLVVDTLAHALRVDDREVSLERRRALEPLVVQLLRRAREGLSADEILRAAGGPGPESADAEHRVRVLISRVRDLLGDPAAIERVRDAGEHGRTRYRLAANVRFALVEPLFSSSNRARQSRGGRPGSGPTARRAYAWRWGSRSSAARTARASRGTADREIARSRRIARSGASNPESKSLSGTREAERYCAALVDE